MRADQQRQAEFLNQHAPAVAADLIRRADAAMAGMLILPGTRNQPGFVGDPPRWNHNPTDDAEYIFGLNRMYHWTWLLRAERLTGDRRYGARVILELDDWIRTCPCPPVDTDPARSRRDFYGHDAWRSLEAGIRMFDTWPVVLEHLHGDERFTPELQARFQASVREHARVLAVICPIFWPRADHNHYLMENLGLLSAVTMFPDFPESAAWRTHAIRELARCAAVQLSDDGGQIEGCPSYHNGCIYWFCYALRLAGADMPAAVRERTRRGMEYTLHSFRPSGTTVPFGDSDATDTATHAAIWWYLAAGDPAPLRTILGLLGPDRARAAIAGHAWTVADPAALLRLTETSAATTLSTVGHQRDLQQVQLRTSWDRDALSVFFACRSPVGHGGGHAHIDPCSFDFTAFGRPLLVDPGRFTYRGDDDRRVFKSALWHNTVTVDDKEPYAYLNCWNYGIQREGRITGVWERPGIMAAAAMQRNFAPAVHRRLVAIIDGAWLLVIDAFSGLWEGATVQIYFHFDCPDAVWYKDQQLMTGRCTDVDLDLAVSRTLTGWHWHARVSEVFDDSHPSMRFRLEDTAGGAERVFAAVAVPRRAGTTAPRPHVHAVTLVDGGVRCEVEVGGVRQRLQWGDDGVVRI